MLASSCSADSNSNLPLLKLVAYPPGTLCFSSIRTFLPSFAKVTAEIAALKKAAGSKILKVIIETCYLTDDEKKTACELCIKAGADFVKTSTGMGTGGATVHDVELLAKVADGRIKVKASGGVDNRAASYAMLNAGAERLGCSKVPQIVSDDTTGWSASKGNQPPKFD